MRWLVLAVTLVSAACGSENASRSTAPTPVATPPAPPPVPMFRGAVTETLTGTPILEFTALVSGTRVTVSAPGHITRETAIATATVDLIRDAAPFDLAFYRQLVRNAFEAPDSIQPLRRQRQSPRVYVRTVDEAGAAIDAATLRVVTDNITARLIESLSGGAITLAALESGTDTRIGMPGWITVSWPTLEGRCGQATVGGDSIELVYSPSRCGDGRVGTFPKAVKHEVGHALGFWHTDSQNDLMFNARSGGNDFDNNPSAREQHHAAIAYARPIGSADIDVDPASTTSTASRRMVVAD